MLNRIHVLISGLILGLLSAACGNSDHTSGGHDGAHPGNVVFFAYEDTFLEEVLDPFRQKTGINVNTPAFADENETETKLRAGFGADVVELCTGEVGSMLDSNLLQSIDTTRIAEWDSIFDTFKEGDGVIAADGNAYIVPLNGGPFGIVYLADKVDSPVESYRQLFSADFNHHIAVSSEPVSTIWDMALALGYGPKVAEISNDEVVKAIDKLVTLDNIRTTWSDDGDLIQLFATGEIVAASHATPDIADQLQEEGINAVFVTPAEGEVLWMCGLGIAAKATHIDAAYQLINHYLSADMQLLLTRKYSYIASNSKILEIAPQALIDAIGLADPGVSDKEIIAEGRPEDETFWDKEWNRFGG